MNRIIEEKKLGSEYRKALSNRIALSIVGIGMNEVGNIKSSHLERYKKVNSYLRSLDYQKQCKKLCVRNMPFVWKVFFVCCKLKITIAVYFMLLAIMILRKI